MQVLLVHGNSEWYGSDRSFVLLARALRREGVDVTVAIPPGELARRVEREGFHPLIADPAPFRGRVFGASDTLRYLFVDLPRAVARFARLARRFDVVHLNTSNLVGALIGTRVGRARRVLHVRESYDIHPRLFARYAALVGRSSTRVIAISRDIASECVAAGFRNVHVVHNGLEFDPAEQHTGDGPVVIVGRLNDWKGHDVLFEALDLLRARGIVVPVAVAGDAFPGREAQAAAIHSLVDRLGLRSQIEFLGYVDDVPALLRRSTLYVQPSRRPEPFGIALVEAMSYGLACIATDIGGPRDIIEPGETGILVPPGDACALADAIERLWSDEPLRSRLGSAAASDVRERFSIERTAKATIDIYRSIVH